MDINGIVSYFINDAEKIKSFVIYLPIIWALLFTKDWFSTISIYKFFDINRSYKAELKQLLNLRYVVTLFLSGLCFVLFCICITIPPLINFFIIFLPLICFLYWIKATIQLKIYESQESPDSAYYYRKMVKSSLYAFRSMCFTGSIFVLLYLGSSLFYNSIPWINESDIGYAFFLCLSFVVICVVIDGLLIRLSTSLNRPSFFRYLVIAELNNKCQNASYFYRLNESVTVVNYKSSTYLVIYPQENESRNISIAIKAIICRKKNNLIYAYLLTNDIIVNKNISEMDQMPFYIDKMTRLGFDTNAISDDSNMSDIGRIELLSPILKVDNMFEYWKDNAWHSIDYTNIPDV